jgi:hypothetical protein
MKTKKKLKTKKIFLVFFLINASKIWSAPKVPPQIEQEYTLSASEKHQQVLGETHIFSKICQSIPVKSEVLITLPRHLEKIINPHVLEEEKLLKEKLDNQSKKELFIDEENLDDHSEKEVSINKKKNHFPGFFFPYTAPHKKFILDFPVVKSILSILKAKKNIDNYIISPQFWRKLYDKGMKFQFRVKANWPLEHIQRAFELFSKESVEIQFVGSLNLRNVFPDSPYQVEPFCRNAVKVKFCMETDMPVTSDVRFSGVSIGDAEIDFLRKNPAIYSIKFDDCFMTKPFSLFGFDNLRVLHLGFCKSIYMQDFRQILPYEMMKNLYDLKIESSDQFLDLYVKHDPVLIGTQEVVDENNQGLEAEKEFMLEKLEICIPEPAYYFSLKIKKLPYLKSLNLSCFDDKLESSHTKDGSSEKHMAKCQQSYGLSEGLFPALETLHLGPSVFFHALHPNAIDFEKIQDLSFYGNDYTGQFNTSSVDLTKFPNLKTFACRLDLGFSSQAQVLKHPKIENLKILNAQSKPRWPKDTDLPSLKSVDFRVPSLESYKGFYYERQKQKGKGDIAQILDYPTKWLVDTEFAIAILQSQKQPLLILTCDSDSSSQFAQAFHIYKKSRSQDKEYSININISHLYSKIISENKKLTESKKTVEKNSEKMEEDPDFMKKIKI